MAAIDRLSRSGFLNDDDLLLLERLHIASNRTIKAKVDGARGRPTEALIDARRFIRKALDTLPRLEIGALVHLVGGNDLCVMEKQLGMTARSAKRHIREGLNKLQLINLAERGFY